MSSVLDLPCEPLVKSLSWCLDLARAPSVRPISEWVESVIKLPNGPMAGERYRHYRHPVSRPFYAELDSGRWSRVAATGPVQNGKTLMCYVNPVLYHLFELKETVIAGLPSLDIANDKWSEDFLPVIMSSGFGHLLPASGEGSRGGQVKRSIHFAHGPTLRFMTAGGGDKKRSAYTSRVVAITETDGMDESSETSREADKVEQIEARTEAFGRTGKRVYLECTASIAKGRIWQEITSGSNSRLLRPCPYCGDWVAPEREHLRGWQEATSSEHAAKISFFACPSCDEPWSEADRRKSAESIIVCHAGQSVDDCGNLIGPYPETQTFGFRWSAIDNPFVSSGDLGAKEWVAARARDREGAEKKCHQFIWALPYDPPEVDMTPLDPDQIAERTGAEKKGIAPDDSKVITIGIDTGKRQLHWTAVATGESGTRVIDYGRHPVNSDRLGVRRALVVALTELARYFSNGWTSPGGRRFKASQVWIDSGYHEHTDAVYEFCASVNLEMSLPLGAEIYRPTKGYGEGQRRMTPYRAPQANTKQRSILYVGTEFHIAKVKRNGRTIPGVLLVHMNSDHWKSELHQRLMMPSEEPLAVTLYQSASSTEHDEYIKHLTAEKQVEKFVEGRGEIVVWDRVDRNNHWLDATYSAICASDAMLEFGESSAARKERKTLTEMAGQK